MHDVARMFTLFRGICDARIQFKLADAPTTDYVHDGDALNHFPLFLSHLKALLKCRDSVLQMTKQRGPQLTHSQTHSRCIAVTFVLQTLLLLALCPTSVVAIEEVDAGGILHSTGNIRIGQGIAAVIAIILGALVCVLGYKLLRSAILVCGFVAGGLLVALVIEYAFAPTTWVAAASWIGFLVGGAIVGCLVLMLCNVGLFLVGALAGALLTFVLNTSFGYRIYPSQPDVVLAIVIIVLALIGGFLVWKLEKFAIILATSFIGATALVWGVGCFAGNYSSGADLKRFRYKDSQGDGIYDIPDAWWAYLCATLLIFLFGVYWQITRSAKGVNHPRPARNATTRHSINDDYQHVLSSMPKLQRDFHFDGSTW